MNTQKSQVIKSFLYDMKHPWLQLARHSNFKTYCDRRDILIEAYNKRTGISKTEFLHAIALESFNNGLEQVNRNSQQVVRSCR